MFILIKATDAESGSMLIKGTDVENVDTISGYRRRESVDTT